MAILLVILEQVHEEDNSINLELLDPIEVVITIIITVTIIMRGGVDAEGLQF